MGRAKISNRSGKMWSGKRRFFEIKTLVFVEIL